MYLKSLDLIGYKSFAAKTHLDLEPGITGIIGPNGCGKSNIMEAVRWCLGEMSWKSLRAGAMTDVIFSGTAKRPPLSMTEVTLNFDNASSMLPVQFSEVTVTRRIFRSGESAYFLNKTQCRLRDIRELFLDTGVGGDGYAIIDQGGVDFVLNSKPEDRRSIFEEAAGVAKYRAKREEALRKLERVEMDMGRLQDSVSLISEQVRKLDSDARKAKLYQKHKEELSRLEAADILRQAAQIQADLEALAAQAAPLEETLGGRRTEMNGEGANLAALNLEKADQQNQVMASNQKISAVKSEIGRLEERIHSAERSVQEIDERRAAGEQELSALRGRLAGMVPELEKASQEVAEAEAARALAQREAEDSRQALAGLAQKLAEAQGAFEALRAEALKAAEEALGLRRELGEAESERSRRETQARAILRELEKDLAQVGKSAEDISQARLALERQRGASAAARSELEAAEKSLSELRRGNQALGEETLRLHSFLAEARARAESLEAQGGQNPYWAGAQAVLNAQIPGVVGTVRQLIKIEEPHKAFLEDLLGERLYALVCEDSSAARAGVELLEDSGKGRARFLVLSSLPAVLAERTFPEKARPLLRHIQFEARHEKAVRFLIGESYALGRVLYGEHWVYGGSTQRETASLSLADVGDLRRRIAEGSEQDARLSGEKARCEAGIAATEDRLRRASAVLNRESAAEHALGAQIDEKEAGLSLCRRNADLSRAEAAGLLADMGLTKERMGLLGSEILRSEAAEKSAREREAQAHEAAGLLKEELARGESAQEVFKSRLHGLEEKMGLLAGSYERLAEQKKSLEATALRREEELSGLRARREEALGLAARSSEELQGLQARLAVLENESQGVFSRLQELEKAISEKEAVLRALKEVCDQAQEQLHQLELKVSAQRSTQDLLKKRLWDDWQLTFDEARTKYGGEAPDPERIESLRKRIAGMGNINMGAPEEYEALCSRQAFLSAQINDLNQAKEDLKSAIQKINNSTRENFRQTFMEVREQFRRLYGVLFEGGEADLVLTEPENILETGVEIVAQPPGKRLQSISLLSGGEKTLTAIALLFAFFMVKPSPFCMLDEADAALDDANVERFVGLLREFQSRTQFLIVSHNKRTMEAADVIYGVTMEEMGVSQLVSVDFRKKAPAASPQELQAARELPDPASEGAVEPA